MARFRGIVQGARGPASRLGSNRSGVTVKANGWSVGVTARVYQCPACGKDRVHAYVTGGSSRDGYNVNLARAVEFNVCPTCEAAKVDLTKPVQLGCGLTACADPYHRDGVVISRGPGDYCERVEPMIRCSCGCGASLPDNGLDETGARLPSIRAES